MKRNHHCAATSANSLTFDRCSLCMVESNIQTHGKVLKNVIEAVDAWQKQARKRRLCVINEHFEPVFNAAAASRLVFQHPDRYTRASLKI
jgi:hypothetical protein